MGITPDEMVRDIKASVKLYRENKYAFQIGLKDLDFAVNQGLLQCVGLSTPLHSIGEAEQALQTKAITPAQFIEEDNTMHEVMLFDPRPVGFSGFMDCVRHSLALTDKGLFEVGRYAAVSLSETNRHWQWFIHRRLATGDQVRDLAEKENLAMDELMEKVYQAYTAE